MWLIPQSSAGAGVALTDSALGKKQAHCIHESAGGGNLSPQPAGLPMADFPMGGQPGLRAL
jgi:hypothetical protein